MTTAKRITGTHVTDEHLSIICANRKFTALAIQKAYRKEFEGVKLSNIEYHLKVYRAFPNDTIQEHKERYTKMKTGQRTKAPTTSHKPANEFSWPSFFPAENTPLTKITVRQLADIILWAQYKQLEDYFTR